jgi:hypothetical protein
MADFDHNFFPPAGERVEVHQQPGRAQPRNDVLGLSSGGRLRRCCAKSESRSALTMVLVDLSETKPALP